jgi:hypothetical protein
MQIVPSLTLQQALELPILTAVALGRAKVRLYKKAMKRSKSEGGSAGNSVGMSAGGLRRQRIGSMAELSEFLSRR